MSKRSGRQSNVQHNLPLYDCSTWAKERHHVMLEQLRCYDKAPYILQSLLCMLADSNDGMNLSKGTLLKRHTCLVLHGV